ncbi:MAG: beta-ketoacyl synthase N-terminal-like domain-containing protein [Acidobacteriota bacterium]
MSAESSSYDVAIVGMVGRFPGAHDIEEYWRNLCDGVECIRFCSLDEPRTGGIDPGILRDPHFVPAVAELDGLESFDAAFFGISHREAELMDPQQRVFLECAWQALEAAGYDAETYPGAIGVFAGATTSTYMLFHLATNPEVADSVDRLQLLIGNAADSLTTRVAYKLNLRGPSFTLQCACSTSLVAVHIACQSLVNRECDMALAGGVSINLSQRTGYRYVEGSILSPDGHCRAFDDDARGTVFGSGIGIVVLKRLDEALRDGDHIHAVIKGTAINNDGSLKVGYTAPGVDGQAKVISEALAVSGVDAARISYIEAHGTGTNLGDPIEIQALTKAFRPYTQKRQFCAIGSVKASIGHLDVAAGVAGLIKTALALERGLIPPSLHFHTPSSKIDFLNSPVYVNAALTEWPASDGPRLAGVSSFGFGGTNAHAILAQAPPSNRCPAARSHELITLSAKSPTALRAAAARFAEHLKKNPGLNMADAAYTLHVGRRAFPHRHAFVCRDLASAVASLEAFDPSATNTVRNVNPPFVFMFTGQGSQYVSMGREVYDSEPLFREKVDRCREILEPLMGFDLLTVLYPGDAERDDTARRLDQTSSTQPALFAIEYAMASLWMDWGIQPHSMIGHSIGEYVAACVAGVFSLEDALRVVAMRGRLMQTMPAGRMVAIPLAADALRPLLDGDLSIAAINEPGRSVVSGSEHAIVDLQRRLADRGVQSQSLHTSHAFHSPMMEPMVDAFVTELQRVHLGRPRIPFISNVSGTWITESQATDARYWGRHLRETVRFADGISLLSKIPDAQFIEVGPGRSLATFAKSNVPDVHCSLRHPRETTSDVAFLLRTLGRLWLAGAPVDWSRFHGRERRQRVPLPVYAFDQRRYWIEPVKEAHTRAEVRATVPADPDSSEPVLPLAPRTARQGQTFHPRPALSTAYVAPRGELERGIAAIWREALGVDKVGAADNFFELGGDSLLATQVASRLNKTFDVVVPLDQVFDEPTVEHIAELILLARMDQLDHEAVAQILADTERVTSPALRPAVTGPWASQGEL